MSENKLTTISHQLSHLMIDLIQKHRSPHYVVQEILKDFTTYKADFNHIDMKYEIILNKLKKHITNIEIQMEALELNEALIDEKEQEPNDS